MSLYIKNLTVGLRPGDKVPKQDSLNKGNVGKYLESVLESQGLTIEPTGIDVPDLRLEVKTRNNNATSPFTFCRMTVKKIISTDFKDSQLYQCIENLLLVRYDDTTNTVTSSEVYNWTRDRVILSWFESSYNQAREKFKQGKSVYTKKTVVRGNRSFGYFEKDRVSNNIEQYEFRVSAENLIKLETTKKQVAFKDLFEVL